jgi:radical SAM superfamily enzyme YgiQ (UPF0313 family)
MPQDPKKLLLIWPPYVTPRWYPLGISFLTAYLKESGISPVDVFDMNAAYLKEIQPLWALNTIFKLGCRIAKKNSLAGNLRDFLEEKRGELCVELAGLGMRFVPWSLVAIMDALSEGVAVEAKQKVARMLELVIQGSAYSVVGISANYPEQLFFSLLAAQHLKKRLGSSAIIVMGGAQVTKHIDYLKTDPRIFDVVDFFVVDDGEEALRRLCLTEEGTRLRDIPNLYFKAEDGSKSFIFSGQYFRLEPDHFLTPDFSGFDPNNYEDLAPLIITKGCYWNKCVFCTFRHGHGLHFCAGSKDKALSLLKGMVDSYGVREFFFVDDALPPPFMDGLAGVLLRDGTRIAWSANIILDKAFSDPAFCRRLKESGLERVNIGLEAVSRRVLGLMNKFHKDLDEEEIVAILKALKDAGIKIQLNIIFGFPTETLDEARQTVVFLVKNVDLFDHAPMQPFSLEDHTQVAENPAKFGITRIYREDKNASLRLGYRYDVKEGMTQSEVIRFVQEEAHKSVRSALQKKKKRIK